MLRAGAAAGTAAALGTAGFLAAGAGRAAAAADASAGSGGGGLPYPPGILDTSHCTAEMAAHTRVRGQVQARRYYTRALGRLPYGPGASLIRAEGSSQGGGYEWKAAPVAAPMRRGHTCIELDEAGTISRVTVVYDSSLLSYPAYQSLVGLAAEAPLS